MLSFSRFEQDYEKSRFKYIEPISPDYRVFANGEEIPVYTCRISEYSFNRVWPSHQRPFDQTCPASFVNIVSDGKVSLEVELLRPHKRVMIKPYSKNIEFAEKDSRVSFSLAQNGSYVLMTDDHKNCLYIFNSKPIEAPDPATVTHYFGPGIHFAGKIVLHDNESLYVDRDALVYGCIYAEGAKNIRVFGNGLFDDSTEERVDNLCYEEFINGNIKLYDCENVSIEGVLFRNSAIWCVNIFHCFDVSIDGIKVFGQWRYNTDGVDIVNSQRVTVKNSFVHSFDDTVVVKGIDRYRLTNCENILTENCTLWCDWGRTCEIGLETACREYKNIVFRNCDILRAGSVALDIQNGDYAEVHDVIFEDIRVEYEAFHAKHQLQRTDDSVFENADIVEIPWLLHLSNKTYKNKKGIEIWSADMNPDDIDVSSPECGIAHHVTVKSITVYYGEGVPLDESGKYDIKIKSHSHYDDHVYRDITVSGITVNGKEISESEANITLENTKNFTFEENKYAQMDKNTVDSKDQMKGTPNTDFYNYDGKGTRVVFAGNSITLHNYLPSIGWNFRHGMAASAPEKDYAHLMMDMIREKDPEAAFCVSNVAEWERAYKDGDGKLGLYTQVREFGADVIIMRFIENSPKADFDGAAFKAGLDKFFAYLDPDKKAKIVMSTGFWRHPGDVAIREYAAERGLPLVELGDLGELDEMKAIGLFEHRGVANHPGDLGMKNIAERLYAKVEKLI